MDNEINIIGLDDDEEEYEEIIDNDDSEEVEDEYGLDDEEESDDDNEETEDDEDDDDENDDETEEDNEDLEEIEIDNDIDPELKKELEKVITAAMLVRENAHHNHYKVGAILKMKSGKYYTGCNINNQDIQSICAERVAFIKAISDGETDFDYILVVGGPVDGFLEKCLPCGYCRQFMSEFVDSDFKIYAYYNDKVEVYTMEELLPNSFEY